MYESLIVAELTFTDGSQGHAGITMWVEYEFDQTAFHSACLAAPFLLGRGMYNWPQTVADMQPKYIPLKNYAMSLFDIAWHDAKARKIGLPLYKVLGASKHRMRAYASSPLFDEIDGYLGYIEQMQANNFSAVKIHAKGYFEEDMELVKAIHDAYGNSGLGFNLDVDANYNYQQALRMGRLLDKCQWDFFEEPMPDTDLSAYKKLTAAIDTDVVPGGNDMPNVDLIRHGITLDCFDRIRFDITSLGGYTAAAPVMGMAQAHRKKVELQCWGYTLSQAANLHLMLAHDACEFFELVTPYDKYEFGASAGFRPDTDGYVQATDQPGLGIDLDWDTLRPFVYLEREFELTER